ncbi:hypothetical protein CDV31_017011 [Fusarium ambrosium]|uniref:LysM domain-containing protein n=1 Tax=Fusarium ambrosium TaxID=131363 RepID=A0A428RW05_9HYPO|nr:hypothetical protein CDV31_017011 [Fusarium ambrosium]
MKPILTLFSISLVSAACTLNYAIWVPRDGDTFAQDVGQALPSFDYGEAAILNSGVNINKIYPGRTYKVPYDASMEIVPPAAWSGDCPRTLQLNQNAHSEQAGSPTSHAVSRGSLDSTATSTGLDSTAKPSKIPTETDTSEDLFSISLPGTLELTGTQSATPDSTTTATGSHSIQKPAATGTGSPLVCWKETHPEVGKFSSSKESRVNFIESFCKRLDTFEINAQHPIEEAPYDDVWIGMQMLPSCPDDAVGPGHSNTCREVLENINDKCDEAGGVFQKEFILYYFVKLGT